LSFERLRLLAGERTKFSICINPDGSDVTGVWNVSFVWRNGGYDYFVNFDGTGRLLNLQHLNPTTDKWADAADNFDVEMENRVTAFTRPALLKRAVR
jgi:hypothetical protein